MVGSSLFSRSLFAAFLFVMANVARRWCVGPEEALRSSNEKFSRRFRAIESGLKSAGKTIEQATLQEMERLYQAEKKRAKAQNDA